MSRDLRIVVNERRFRILLNKDPPIGASKHYKSGYYYYMIKNTDIVYYSTLIKVFKLAILRKLLGIPYADPRNIEATLLSPICY